MQIVQNRHSDMAEVHFILVANGLICRPMVGHLSQVTDVR